MLDTQTHFRFFSIGMAPHVSLHVALLGRGDNVQINDLTALSL
jgi:hypothetical protein